MCVKHGAVPMQTAHSSPNRTVVKEQWYQEVLCTLVKPPEMKVAVVPQHPVEICTKIANKRTVDGTDSVLDFSEVAVLLKKLVDKWHLDGAIIESSNCVNDLLWKCEEQLHKQPLLNLFPLFFTVIGTARASALDTK